MNKVYRIVRLVIELPIELLMVVVTIFIAMPICFICGAIEGFIGLPGEEN